MQERSDVDSFKRSERCNELLRPKERGCYWCAGINLQQQLAAGSSDRSDELASEFLPSEAAQGLSNGRIIKTGYQTANVAASWFVYPAAPAHCEHNPPDRNTKITASKRADRTTVT